MIWDIDDLLEDLGRVIASTLKDLEDGKVVETRSVVGDDMSQGHHQSLDTLAVPDSATAKPPAREPLVDVFDDAEELRVVVELPGVKKEDVRIEFLHGVLRIEVNQDGKVHRRDVLCKVAPGA